MTHIFYESMRILFVKLSSIGDIVHTLPALAAVRENLPDARISWVVERRAAEILRNNPLLDNLIEIDTRAFRQKNPMARTLKIFRLQLRALRRREFDLAIDFQGLLKSASIAKFARARKTYGFSKKDLREPASRVFLSKTIKIAPGRNIIRKNIDLAEGAIRHFLKNENFRFDETAPDFPIAASGIHRAEAASIIEQAGENFCILNPAGGWRTKLWHAEKYGELADRIWNELKLTPVISTAPNELELAEEVLKNSSSGKTISVQPSLKGFYELAKRAKIYVGGDTAPTHLAVAAKCPVVGIFGPTEWWRNGSINPFDICVERLDIGCRVDCHRRKCDKWICMDVSVETVFAAIRERLSRVETGREFNSLIKKIDS